MVEVNVGELRQNLSVYLEGITADRSIEVKEAGRVVAVIKALPPGSSDLDRLEAAGLLIRSKRSLKELGPPQGEISTGLTDALEEQRADLI